MVPKRLKEAREQANLSQEKLAELIGIDGSNTRARLSNYEVGRSEPPFSLVVKIAQAIDYPEYYFYTVDDNLAHDLLSMHKKRIDPEQNNFYSSVIEQQKLTIRLREAEKKLVEAIDILRNHRN